MKTPMNKTVVARLLEHIDGPVPHLVRNHDAAARSLVLRSMIRFDSSRRHTVITPAGRQEAVRLLAAQADKLSEEVE